MTTETQPSVQPIVTDGAVNNPTNPVAQNNDSGGATSGGPQPITVTAPDQQVVPPAPAPAPTEDKVQKRINELTAKRYESERIAEEERNKRLAAEQIIQELKKTTTPPAQQPQIPAEEIERLANEKAMMIARANEFNKACNKIVETGKTTYNDWNTVVENLRMVGAIGEKVSPEFLETAIELKDPHKVLHYLGTNLEEAERIVKSNPKQMALAMARIEAQISAPPPAPAPVPLSSAPAPVVPVAGSARPGALSLDDPSAKMDEWIRMREQQVQEKKNRYRKVS